MRAALGLLGLVVVGFASPCSASNLVAAEQVSGTSVGFVLAGSYSNATLTISGPTGFHATMFSRGGAIAIDIGKSGPVADGTYHYQLTAASSERAVAGDSLDNGRGNKAKSIAFKPATKSGTFNVKDGAIVNYGVPARASRRDPVSR